MTETPQEITQRLQAAADTITRRHQLRSTYIVTIRPAADVDQGTETRALRSMLKVLLRRYGLTCLDIRESQAPEAEISLLTHAEPKATPTTGETVKTLEKRNMETWKGASG